MKSEPHLRIENLKEMAERHRRERARTNQSFIILLVSIILFVLAIVLIVIKPSKNIAVPKTETRKFTYFVSFVDNNTGSSKLSTVIKTPKMIENDEDLRKLEKQFKARITYCQLIDVESALTQTIKKTETTGKSITESPAKKTKNGNKNGNAETETETAAATAVAGMK